MYPVDEIQKALNSAGVGPVAVDGKRGPMTVAAIKRFQKKKGLMADGLVGPKTWMALTGSAVPSRDVDPPRSPATGKAAKAFPRQSGVEQFYGKPGGPQCTAGTCVLPARMRIAWNLKQTVGSFKCHELVAEPMTAIFAETVKHYGEDNWRKLGLDLFGGCYNFRAMRGGTRYSMHSWGIAVDIDPARNQLKWNDKQALLARPEYASFWDIVEEHGALSLGRARNFDWMHFQFARL